MSVDEDRTAFEDEGGLEQADSKMRRDPLRESGVVVVRVPPVTPRVEAELHGRH